MHVKRHLKLDYVTLHMTYVCSHVTNVSLRPTHYYYQTAAQVRSDFTCIGSCSWNLSPWRPVRKVSSKMYIYASWDKNIFRPDMHLAESCTIPCTYNTQFLRVSILIPHCFTIVCTCIGVSATPRNLCCSFICNQWHLCQTLRDTLF